MSENPFQCRYPVEFRYEDKLFPVWRTVMLRCRKCGGCRRHMQRQWNSRIVAESVYSSLVVFNTLTYAEVPEDARSATRHLQLYRKRLRKAGLDHRYFCSLEYGGVGKRLHHHEILFFADVLPDIHFVFDTIRAQWTHGFCKPELPRSAAAYRYAAKYTVKDHHRPCFSRRLGGKVFDEIADALDSSEPDFHPPYFWLYNDRSRPPVRYIIPDTERVRLAERLGVKYISPAAKTARRFCEIQLLGGPSRGTPF